MNLYQDISPWVDSYINKKQHLNISRSLQQRPAGVQKFGHGRKLIAVALILV
jgi:hypothetical protein